MERSVREKAYLMATTGVCRVKIRPREENLGIEALCMGIELQCLNSPKYLAIN
jgi:hypothetical protein